MLMKVITKNYYDNYTFPNAPSLPSLVEGQTVETNVKGFPYRLVGTNHY